MRTLATVTFKAVSGFAEDRVTNSFALDLDDGWDPAVDGDLSVVGPLMSFYNLVPADATVALHEYMSSWLDRTAGAVDVKLYNVESHLDGSPHGSPFYSTTSTLAAIGGTSGSSRCLPEEVALAITLRGTDWATTPVETADGSDAGTAIDRPRQRHTGKVYLGPLASHAVIDGAAPARPSPGLLTAATHAVKDMQSGLGVAGHMLCVWSRVNATFYPVTDAQVDNAFDTQRRRGAGATSRTTLAM